MRILFGLSIYSPVQLKLILVLIDIMVSVMILNLMATRCPECSLPLCSLSCPGREETHRWFDDLFLMTLIFYLSLTDLMTCFFSIFWSLWHSTYHWLWYSSIQFLDQPPTISTIIDQPTTTNHQPPTTNHQPQLPTTTTTRPECELLSRARDLLALNSERDVQQVRPSDICSMF